MQSACIGQRTRTSKNTQKHLSGQLSRICILQRWMITREQPALAWYGIFHSMRELQWTALFYLACAYQVSHESIKSDLAEANYNTQPRKQGNFLVEKCR